MDRYKLLVHPAIVGIVLTLCVVGCALVATDQPSADSAQTAPNEAAAMAKPEAAANEPASGAAPSAPVQSAAAATVASATASSAAAATKVADMAAIVEPPRVVDSCKKEQYTKFEEASRNSIKAGWEATKAERFGVGFRNADEYTQWSNTHNAVFKQTNEACDALAKCAKDNPDSKQKQCAAQAELFRDWQVLAKKFSERVKQAEFTQVDKLCSLEPQLSDPRDCFEHLAENVSNACKGDACQELSRCWQSIAFMDGALRQAETACGFVHTKLEQCRGYTEQQGRRKAQLERCAKMQEKSNLRVLPVL